MTEKRTHPRVPLSQTASVTTQGKTRQVTLGNLSVGGAFLMGSVDLPLGSGIRISFRLSTGLPVTLNGKVVRASANIGGAGIQFFAVDDVTREILDDYLRSLASGVSTNIDAEVSVKYQLNTRNGRIDLTLSGYLESGDCVRLRELMTEHVKSLGRRDLMIVIDASLFACCSPEGLKEFRAWLQSICSAHTVVGALIGPRTVGVLQLRRIVRDAQIADTFMGFDTTAEAEELLQEL